MGESGWTARQIAGALVIAVGLLLFVEWIWVTDTERIESRLETLSAAVESHDTDGAMECFSKDFRFESLDWHALAAVLRMLSTEKQVRHLSVRSVQIEFDTAGDTAESAIVFNLTAKRDDGGFPGTVDIALTWERGVDGWRIIGISDPEFFFEWLGNNRVPLRPHLKRYTVRAKK